jgi:phage terminase large subunit
MEKLHAMALLNPRMRGLICRKSATSLSSTALVTWRQFVAKEAIESGDVIYYGGSAQEPASYQYKNGSVIVIGGLDKVSKIMSAEYDIIYVQEATELTENDWEALTTRLRNWKVSFQQLLADCNPQNPEHWLKMRADRGRTKLFASVHEDNPILFDHTPQPRGGDGSSQSEYRITERGRAYIAKLDALTGFRHKRLRLGLWVAAEGVIYEEYQSAIHIIDRKDLPTAMFAPTDRNGIPLTWRRYWAVDFGFVHPFVCQFWAEDPDGRLYLYREIYHTHRTVAEHSKTILSLVTEPIPTLVQDEDILKAYAKGQRRWIEPRPQTVVCDHDAEGREVLETALAMSTSPAHKSVLEGIDATIGRFKIQGDGRPRIYFLRNAVYETDPELADSKRPASTTEEIPAYVWMNKAKEGPLKENDDGCDSMRYMVAEKEFGIRVIFRSFTA